MVFVAFLAPEILEEKNTHTLRIPNKLAWQTWPHHDLELLQRHRKIASKCFTKHPSCILIPSSWALSIQPWSIWAQVTTRAQQGDWAAGEPRSGAAAAYRRCRDLGNRWAILLLHLKNRKLRLFKPAFVINSSGTRMLWIQEGACIGQCGWSGPQGALPDVKSL